MRKNLFQKYNPHFRGIYAARDDYLKGMGWVNIPLELAPAIHSQTTVLLDLAKDSPFLSCVIGIAPAHSLKMEPHGDCRSPSDIASASLRFVLQPPCPRRMPTFHHDYMVALEKFCLLQNTIPASTEITASHPFLCEDKDELSFCHPLFVRSGQVCALSCFALSIFRRTYSSNTSIRLSQASRPSKCQVTSR